MLPRLAIGDEDDARIVMQALNDLATRLLHEGDSYRTIADARQECEQGPFHLASLEKYAALEQVQQLSTAATAEFIRHM